MNIDYHVEFVEHHYGVHEPQDAAVHPITGEIVVLSAIDRVLVSFDRKSQVTGYALLDAKLLAQPEGLTFFSNGDMILTTEGAESQAALLRYRWNRAGG